jgi:hypothetical protein
MIEQAALVGLKISLAKRPFTVRAGEGSTARSAGRASSWIAWCTAALRSRIKPMKSVARMIRRHRELILNWFRAKGAISNGIVEGLNNKAKLTNSGDETILQEPTETVKRLFVMMIAFQQASHLAGFHCSSRDHEG